MQFPTGGGGMPMGRGGMGLGGIILLVIVGLVLTRCLGGGVGSVDGAPINFPQVNAAPPGSTLDTSETKQERRRQVRGRRRAYVLAR